MQKLAAMLSALALVFSATGQAADNQLTSQEQAQGWQLLFNGKDMSQWRNYQQESLDSRWQVENGTIKMSEAGAGDILTRTSFKDFELQLQWKIAEGGNSGIFILVDEEGPTIYSHAPEIQILDNEKAHDNKIDTHLAGSLYDMVAVHPSALRPTGDWNDVTIRLKDDLLQVWQNGVMTTNLVLGSSTWERLVASSKFAGWKGFGENRSGPIGLQDHGDLVWFKNIKIKEL